MNIQWVEDICNKGGIGANDRLLIRKLADEIYRLTELKIEDRSIEFQMVYKQYQDMNQSLKAEVEVLRTENLLLKEQLEPKQEEVTEPSIKKRGRPSKKNDAN